MALFTRISHSSQAKKAITKHFQNSFTTTERYLTTAGTSTTSVKGVYRNDDAQTKPFEDIPGPSGIYNIPVVGLLLNMKPFGKFTPATLPYLINEMADRYGPIFRMQTNGPTIVITEPKDIRTLVKCEGKYPHRPDFDIMEVFRKRTGHPINVGSAQGAEWGKLRAPLQKALMKPNVVPQYTTEMSKVANDLIKMLSNGYLQHNDVEKTFMAFTTESVAAIFFNKRMGFLQEDQPQKLKNIQKAIDDFFHISYKAGIGAINTYRIFRSKDYKDFESATLYLSQTFGDYLRDAVKELRMKETVSDNDFLNLALKGSTEEEIKPMIEVAFNGAIESSASAIQVMLYTLANNQDKQEKLRKELCGVLGHQYNNDKVITDEDIRRMPYLIACVKEMYRLFPVTPLQIVRTLPVDVVFSGYHIPAGTQVWVHTMKTCRNAAIFENPDKFEPERWIREGVDNNKKTSANSTSIVKASKKFAVIPFGVGPRSCPGRRIFEQELHVLMSKLIHGFRVDLEPESRDVEFEYRLFRKPVKPLKFTFTPVE